MSVSRQVTSPDLRQWTIRETLLETDEGMAEEDIWRYTSFSYVDWQFEGPDVRSPFPYCSTCTLIKVVLGHLAANRRCCRSSAPIATPSAPLFLPVLLVLISGSWLLPIGAAASQR